jgi:1,4-alpha-glucan branching enzyme
MADTTGWDKVKWDTEKEVALDTTGQYKITYYLTQWTDPSDSSSVIYELHGNCWAWGVDLSTWTSGSSELTCNLGFYYDESVRVDWE